jgi:GNAT superfamily N-acetyltransferase
MTGPALRRAIPADAPEVAELFLASRRDALPYLPALHTDDDTRRWMAEVVFAAGEVWVAAVDGRIVGFAALNGGRDHLDHLYLLPGWYGRGIGSALLLRVKERSTGRLQLWTFQRNVRARAFYEARGFSVAALADGSANEEREPDVLYRWTAVRGADGSAGHAFDGSTGT